MLPVPGGIDLAPGGSIDLQRAGYHLMFIRPRRPFQVGDRIPVVLRFRRAGPIRVAFIVGEGAGARNAMPGMRM